MAVSKSGDVNLVARAGIRAGAADRERLAKDGWSGWVKAQLQMPSKDGADVAEQISKAVLPIEYEAGDGYHAKKENRHLELLNKTTCELWHLADWDTKMAWAERVRPADELHAATILRATLSDAQLRESVTDFWRDHFAVNRDAVEDVAIALPTYDQDVLRLHAFGNFREMLEAVATSTAMLAYLNNASSKASPANENYARELLELHTLGAPAYLNASFDRWREVPGVLQGKPQGFIDQDVYEAARAFTGWTYGGGQYVSDGVSLPKTGEFTYTEQWHDPYQKRVLGVEFDPHTAPMADGRKVLDLVAFHPATAQYVCYKLCRRFVSDVPPPDLVKSAAHVFADSAGAKDQLAKVIEHILLAPEFANAEARLQRPLFLFASLQRSSGVILPPTQDNVWMLNGMGQSLYGWPSPAGHPLASAYWQSPGLLVRRWRAMSDIWTRMMAQEPDRDWPTMQSFAQHWADALGLDEQHAALSAGMLAKEYGDADRQISFVENERWTTAQALTVLSASPSYQTV
jgi:uncharacterized protein (DUF1800 family)